MKTTTPKTSASLGNECQIIKDTINIVEFCERVYNAAFIVSPGGWYNTNCLLPNHEDNSPSFGVNIDSSKFNCFGCGEKGTVIDLVMKIEQLSLGNAVKFLLDYLGLQPDASSQKFYTIHRLLRQKGSKINKEVLLNAKIKQIKQLTETLTPLQYYSEICNLFGKYNDMSDEDFMRYIYSGN